jgi:hypothetical protein
VRAVTGTVSTYAGRGRASPFSGDGQTPRQAGLGEPVALAVDGAGNVFVAERVLGAKFQNARSVVRMIEAGTRVTRIAGSGAAPYTRTATGWTRNGSMAQGNPQDLTLSLVGGLAVDGTSLFASLVDATGEGVVVKFDLAGRSLTRIAGGGSDPGDGPALAARLSAPAGLAALPGGDLLVAEFGADRLRRITAAGQIITVAGGNPVVRVPVPSRTTKPSGRDPSFMFQRDAIGDGGPADRSVLQGPRAVIVGSAGSIYVSESVGHRVRQIAGTGTITTVAGTGRAGFSGDGGAATQARLYAPHGLALNAAGDLFIADTFNHRIRVVSANAISTVAGTGTRGYSGDGGPAGAATFSRPGMLTFLNGRLLVADEDNQVIREIALT